MRYVLDATIPLDGLMYGFVNTDRESDNTYRIWIAMHGPAESTESQSWPAW